MIYCESNTGVFRTLQGSRIIFALLIFLSHFVTPTFAKPFDFGGECGVAFFFVLSGFVLSWRYGPEVSRGQFLHRKFFLRHFFRLYPLHLLLLIVAFLLQLREGEVCGMKQLFTQLLLIQSWIPYNPTLYSLNTVAWYLCDMIFFYAIFPWVYRLVIGVNRKTMICSMLPFAVCYGCVASVVPDDMVNCTLYANPLLRSVDFALGVLVYRFYKTHRRLFFTGIGFWSGAVCGVSLLLATYFAYMHLGLGIRCAALFWIVIPAVLCLLLRSEGKNDLLDRILGSRGMVGMGALGFEFFMSHTLVLKALHQYLFVGGGVWHDVGYLFTALIATVGLSYLLHKFFVKKISGVLCRCLLRE